MGDLDEDFEDIHELEQNLYAKIHHDAPSTVTQLTHEELQIQQKQNEQPLRLVTNKTIVNNSNAGPPVKGGRYWIGSNKNDGVGGGQQWQPPNKSKHSHHATKNRVNPFSGRNTEKQQNEQPAPQPPVISAEYRPKPFTPYTSIFSNSTELANTEQCDLQKTDSKAVPAAPVVSKAKLTKKDKRRPNPYNRINEDKMNRVKKMQIKIERVTRSKTNIKPKEIINLDTSEESDEDDVICIPVTPPPLVCIESSGDEAENDIKPDNVAQTNEEDDSAESRTDDFIGQRDRSRISQSTEALGGLCDEELELICKTVEDAIQDSNRKSNHSIEILPTEKIPDAIEIDENPTVSTTNEDNVVFATPTHTSASYAMSSYEVQDNSFAAVDVYESESSDFPESVYEKGKPQANIAATAQTAASDSDYSDIQINTQNRSKRMKKRKSSGSNKGSDYLTCSDEDDCNDSDGEAFVNILKSTSTPHIKRGEAVNNAKIDIHKLKSIEKRKKFKSSTVPQSDDDFMSLLSCIVHDGKDDDDDDVPCTQNESTESIDARDIVEQVLSKTTKSKSKENVDASKKKWVVTDEVQSGNLVASVQKDSTEMETNEGKCNEWVIKDQVGETDLSDNEDMNTLIMENTKELQLSDESLESANKKKSHTQNEEKKDNNSVRSCSLVVDPEIGWTDEMKCFYNKSWNGENHNQIKMQLSMPNELFEWSINNDDIYQRRPHQYNKTFRYINCRELGHKARDCYQPPKQIKCHMCGVPGHQEPRCPNKLCLRCGNKMNSFTRTCYKCNAISRRACALCNTKGHIITDCPDKWRRYHSTTEPNVPLTKLPILFKKPKFCCICAANTHTAETCRNALRILDTPVPMLKIQSYQETYTQIKIEQNDETAPFALFSVPDPEIKFAWDVNEAPDRFYGRIMKATDIKRSIVPVTMKRKRVSKKNNMVINPVTAAVAKTAKKTCTDTNKLNELPNTLLENVSIADDTVIILDAPIAKPKYLDGTTLEIDEKNDTVIEHIKENDDLDVSNFSFAKAIQEIEINKNESLKNIESLDNTIINNKSNESVPIKDLPMTDDTQIIEHSTTDNYKEFSFTSKLLEIEREKNQCIKSNTFDLSFLVESREPSGNDGLTSPTVSNIEVVVNIHNTIKKLKQSPSIDKSRPIPTIEQTKCNQPTLVPHPSQINELKTLGIEQIQSASVPVTEPDEEENINNTTPTTPTITLPTTSPSDDVNGKFLNNAPKHSSHDSSKIRAEVLRLEKEEQYLNILKKSMIKGSKNRPIDNNTNYHVSLNEDVDQMLSTNVDKQPLHYHDSDSNYSFSDYFIKNNSQPDDTLTTEEDANKFENLDRLPDFIPLDNSFEYSPTQIWEKDDDDDDVVEVLPLSEKRVLKPADTACEAKIFLTKDHSKYLLTKKGSEFLTETYTKHNVIVRMEWRNIGNILIVQGTSQGQDSFHADLIEYCEKATEEMRKKQEISQQVPKNRLPLIRFIKEQLSQLDKPMGNVKELYIRMRVYEQQHSKTGNKNADRARRVVNMILMGVTGLRDGEMHLNALQQNLRFLLNTEQRDVIPNSFRNEVFQHFRYIFSSFVHDDYSELIHEYGKLKKNNQLPTLKLDRKLIGLKIDVNYEIIDENTTVQQPTTSDSGELITLEHAKEKLLATSAASTSGNLKINPFSKIKHDAEMLEPPPPPILSHTIIHAHTESTNNTSIISGIPTTKLKTDVSIVSTPSNIDLTDVVKRFQKETDTSKDTELMSPPDPPSKKGLPKVDDKIKILEFENSIELLDEISQGKRGDERRHAGAKSAIWSAKCEEFVDKCKKLPKIQANSKAMAKLKNVANKAKRGELSYNDYKCFVHIFGQLIKN